MKNVKRKGLIIACIVAGLIISGVGLWAIVHASSDKNKPDPALAENPSPTPPLKTVLTKDSPEDYKPKESGTEEAPPADSDLPEILDDITFLPVKPTGKADVSPTPTVAPSEQTPAPMETDNGDKTPNIASLIEISREEAGLNTIPKINLDGFTLHKRIQELLDGDTYSNEDMKMGIEKPSLITERFQYPIIENITIGTSIDVVVQTLGDPSLQENGAIFYKTTRYYVCFFGEKKVEAVNFAPIPELQNEDILKSVFTALCIDNVYLTDYLDSSQEASDFFDSVGHIHGGGNYAISSEGVNVDTLSGTIEVFNNFEGCLYRIDGETESGLEIRYINEDFIMDDLCSGYWSYTAGNRQFTEEGKMSPSGTYSAIYEWITSDHHYFTIRTNDHSAPDYIIGAEASEFQWVNDDYIVYTAMFSTLPVVMRVTNDYEKQENILLIPGIDEFDYFYDSAHDFTIAAVNKNSIILQDKNVSSTEEKAFWSFCYSIDENGNFIAGEVNKQELSDNSLPGLNGKCRLMAAIQAIAKNP